MRKCLKIPQNDDYSSNQQETLKKHDKPKEKQLILDYHMSKEILITLNKYYK